MKRSIARWGLLAALLAIVALSTGLLQVMVSASSTAIATAVESGLRSAPPTASALRVENNLGDTGQTDAASAFFAQRFNGLPVEVYRTASAGTVEGYVVESDAQLQEHARLDDGSWPGGPDEAVLQTRAAAAAGLGVGDIVVFTDGPSVRIVGLWQPVDARDPYWFASPAAASGFDSSDLGPLVVEESLLQEFPAQVVERWTIVPSAVPPALAPAVSGLREALEREGINATVEGALAATTSRLLLTATSAERIVLVPETIVALIALVTLARVAALLWSVRGGETVLLRARGTSRSRLLWTAVAEALPIVVLGGALGSLVPGSSPALGVAAPGVALLVLLLAAVLGIRTITTVASRSTRTVTAGAAVLAVILAGVALWQYLLYTNSSGANPLGALAPALGLLAVALLAVMLLSPLFRLLERLASRRVGVSPVLPVRHLARDAAVHATSVLLVVLAIGGATFAAGYTGTARAREARVLESGNGSDVRVHLEVGSAVDGPDGYLDSTDYAGLEGAESARAVLFTEARIGADTLEFTALPSRPEGPAVAGAIEVQMRVRPQRETELGRVTLAGWYSDPDGQAIRVTGPEVLASDAAEGFAASIPVPTGDWTLLAIEARSGGISGSTIVGVEMMDVTAGGTSVLAEPRTLNLAVARPTGRVMVAESAAPRLPVTVTEATAQRLSAPIGSPLTLSLPASGGTIDAVVAAIVPAVPGATGSLAAQADLAAVVDYTLRSGQRVPQPNEVWIASNEPAALADEAVLIAHSPASVTTRSNDDGLAGPLGVVFLISAAGAALLAVIGVAAVAGSLGRERDRDRLVLDALGVSPTTISRTRFAEFALSTLTAVVLGLGAGLIATLVFVPTLARSTGLAVDPLILAVALALALGCIVVGAVASRRDR